MMMTRLVLFPGLSVFFFPHKMWLMNSLVCAGCLRFMRAYSTIILNELETQNRERRRVAILYWVWRSWSWSRSSRISCVLHQAKRSNLWIQLNIWWYRKIMHATNSFRANSTKRRLTNHTWRLLFKLNSFLFILQYLLCGNPEVLGICFCPYSCNNFRLD